MHLYDLQISLYIVAIRSFPPTTTTLIISPPFWLAYAYCILIISYPINIVKYNFRIFENFFQPPVYISNCPRSTDLFYAYLKKYRIMHFPDNKDTVSINLYIFSLSVCSDKYLSLIPSAFCVKYKKTSSKNFSL